MKNLNTNTPMRPELIVCPNPACGANERIGIHSRKKRQYICHTCHKSFAETKGTMLYGLKYPIYIVLQVLALLSHGCPIPAIVFAFGLDERTVIDWQRKAGKHAKQLHLELIQQAQLQLGQVQVDELYAKIPSGKVWIATAISVFSRLWLGGAVSWYRDEKLIHSVIKQVRAASAWGSPLLCLLMAFGLILKRL
jgi:transposase-like protein